MTRLLTLAALLIPPALAAADRPNLIFIMADDLGYGDLGCYGQKTVKTPEIDRLAKEGLRFTDFYAGSTVCAPSRCVLMTGLHTGHCFIRGNGKDNLRPEDVTVAEVLKRVGYTTALYGKWGLGHEGSSGLPTRQGFDEFYGYLDQHHAHNYYPSFLVRNGKREQLRNVVPNEGRWGQGVASEKKDYSHDLIMEGALDFVRRAAKRKPAPFFLYLSITIPHANNEAGKKGMEVPEFGEYGEGNDWAEPERGFAAMVSRMDRDIGRLRRTLEESGVADDTVIFFTSDNGPHAEGGRNPKIFDSNGPLKGTKRDLTDGGIRVPLIVHWPGKVASGTTTDFVGSFQDVLPTLASLADGDAGVPPALDGLSFAPTILGRTEAQKQHDHLYWAFYERGGAEAVRVGTLKAIVQPHGTPMRIYDLATDLGEEKNLAADRPELVPLFKALMSASYTPSERWKFPKPRRRSGKKRRG